MPVADSPADQLRGLLASDVYTEQGWLRADDQLVRERVAGGLTESTARIRVRRAEQLIRAIDDLVALVRGLPVLNSDRVWNRVRRAEINDPVQFDWSLVYESDAMPRDLDQVTGLDGSMSRRLRHELAR